MKTFEDVLIEIMIGGSLETPQSKTFSHIKYDAESIQQSEEIKSLCEQIESKIEKLGSGRYQSLAKTHLEITFMMVGKAIREVQFLRDSKAPHLAARDNSKPIVKIKDAYFVVGPHGLVLTGIPVDHYRQQVNGCSVETSKVVSFEGNRVETENTNYEVLNWSISGYA